MNKNKELIKNTLVFGFGTIGTKAMQFILIPLYSSVLSTEEFGCADLIVSTVSLISPFLMLGISSGVFRFILNHRENEKGALKLALIISFIGIALNFLIMPFWNSFEIFGGYGYLLPFVYSLFVLKNVFSQYCKAIEKNVIYALDGIISTITLTVFSIIFLLIYSFGIKGYIYAIIISNLISVIYFVITCSIIETLKNSRLDKKLSKEMLKYSLPLTPNELSWWVIQMSDRYMLIFFCGPAINGIYSMSYKIPGIFNILVSIFIQAFGITAIKECDYNDNEEKKIDGEYFQNIYKKYIAFTFITVDIVILLSKPLAYLFLKKDFFISWRYIPLLLIAYAIGNLQAFYGSIYNGIKDTKMISVSTFSGMLINIVLNMILIPRYNAYGAAIATIASYVTVYLLRMIGLLRYVNMKHFVFEIGISFVVLIIISYCYTNVNGVTLSLIIICSLFLIYLYRITIREIFISSARIINLKIGRKKS